LQKKEKQVSQEDSLVGHFERKEAHNITAIIEHI